MPFHLESFLIISVNYCNYCTLKILADDDDDNYVSKSSNKRTDVKVFWLRILFGRDDPNFSTAFC